MNTSIFIPKKINVGYQNRNGTYTGKLAYIIYFDEKGVLRKQNSWDSWRDKKIPNTEFDNVPIEGFVLNKHIGGYSGGWDYRQSYCRIYDPRGFEFEITIDNLLYILENTSSIKGKGLEGEFIYGWDKTQLILIPTSSPDYKNILEFSSNVFNAEKIRTKDLVVGAKYLMKDGNEVVYMGQHDYGRKSSAKFAPKNFYWLDGGNRFWFARKEDEDHWYFYQFKTIPKGKIIKCLDVNASPEYSKIYEKMLKNNHYGPCDPSKNRFVRYSYEEFVDRIDHGKKLKDNYSRIVYEDYLFLINQEDKYKEVHFTPRDDEDICFYIQDECGIDMSAKDFYEKYEPGYIETYLPDGTFYAKCVSFYN